MSDRFSLGSVEVELAPADRFAEYLQNQGKRYTQQRRLIVETVFSHHDHFDADELLDHLKGPIARREVSRPTVYRTLAELVDAGMLLKMNLHGRSVFEHSYGYPQHDHLLCKQCGRLIEFHSPELERIRRAVAQRHDFQVFGHRMMISGICADCRRHEAR